jgi:hypothetical protein
MLIFGAVLLALGLKPLLGRGKDWRKKVGLDEVI